MGDFIAKENIPWGGVNAYTRGQRVSADVVEANDWQDYVTAENSKEAHEIKAEITGHPVSDFETAKSAGSEKGSTSSRSAKTTTEQEG